MVLLQQIGQATKTHAKDSWILQLTQMSIFPSFLTAKSASACTSSLLATSQAMPTTFLPLCLDFRILDTIASESAAMSRLRCFSSTSCWSSVTVSLTDSGLSPPGSHPQNKSHVSTCSKLYKYVQNELCKWSQLVKPPWEAVKTGSKLPWQTDSWKEQTVSSIESVDFILPTRSYNDIVSSLQKLSSKSLAQATGAVDLKKWSIK